MNEGYKEEFIVKAYSPHVVKGAPRAPGQQEASVRGETIPHSDELGHHRLSGHEYDRLGGRRGLHQTTRCRGVAWCDESKY